MLNDKINNEWKILKKGTRSDYSVIIGVTILLLLIIAMNVHLIFNMISNQTEGMGQMQLENIRSELQTTLTDAENTTKRIAIEAEQMMASNASKEQLTAYFEEQCKVQNAIFKDACMDVYIAGRDWAIIPNFDIPADYHPPERIWYKGAVENPGELYITEPYLDARTGTMCYTMSIMLSDKQTVVALDFNFINTQNSVFQMNKDGGSSALIATKNGKIISHNDMSLVGEYISKKLPEYDIIFNKVVNQTTHSSFSAQVDGSTHTIFSSETNNGWYMMLSVDNWALYKDDYKQTMLYTLASILMLLVVIFFYLVGVKNRLRAEQALRVKEEFLSNLSHELREPLQKILTLSNLNKMKTDVNHTENATQIRESAVQLSGMLDNLFTFSTLVSTENKNADKDNQDMKISQTSHRVRIGIISVLIVAMIFSLGICINNIINWGDTKMNREADIYDYQLSNWIARHKSILSMFTSMISERPQIMNDYETAVQWLNDIAKNYPEISVCYMANPYKEHQVIMNNGWEGPEGWHVEKRPWYIDTEKSETGFNISAPYYDDQTGLYCVTFSQIVYGKNGEFLGIFAIDFLIDKLIHILGNSYTPDGYAFLVDRNGVIINHPSSDFELSVDNTTPITVTNYFKSYQNKSITNFTDYNGTYSTCLAKKNETSDFTVIIVSRWWNIYGNIVILGSLFILLFGICIAAVILLINKLIRWQESVNLQLKASADTAVAAGQAKSQFLAQMSHEIRTPINVVIGMNEMILRECRDVTITKYANNVATASETLLSLINDILDFSKIESGKMELVEETYRLDEMIENLINMIRPRAEKKNLEFKVEVDETIPNELFGDSVRIRQVVINFLTNAVKYTQVGRVTFIVSKEDKLADEIMLNFSVKDTGIGIRDEDKKKLFRDFERFDSKKNKNIEGTGLGLAITYKLVNMMKGSIDVASTYGEGSTFTVMLPQKVMGTDVVGSFEQKVEAVSSKQEAYKVSFIAPEAKILVVDDNEMNLLVATSLLKATQIQVDTAMSGMSALKKMADKKYDLIFLDQMMPSLDGIQTLHLANEMEENKSKGVPMIALTANAISGAREMFLKEGFTDYLSKPIDAKQMEAMLMTYLPIDKLHAPPKEDEVDEIQQMIDDSFNQIDDLQDQSNETTAQQNYEYINVDLGMQYSAGMADMYKNILIMFCNLKNEKQIKMQEAFDNEDWQNYTTLVHALKSTALSIGGEKTSEAAKQLELAGKMIISGATSELEKQQGTEYIKEHHAEAMELYDKLVEDGRKLIDNL